METKTVYKIQSLKDDGGGYFEQKLEYQSVDDAIFEAKKLLRPSRIVKKTTTTIVIY
jgi:hypothetical protein